MSSAVQKPPAPHTPAYAIMRGLGNIFNLLNAINAAVNIVLYCAFSDKYRRTFLKMFVPCVFRRKTRSLSFLTTAGEQDALGGGAGNDYGRSFRLSPRGSATTKSLRAAPHSSRSSLRSSRSSSFRSTRPADTASRFTDRKTSGEGVCPGDGAWSGRRNNSTCSPVDRSASSTASYDSKQIKRFSFDPSPSDTPVPECLVIPDITITTTTITTTTITTPSTVNTSLSSPPLEGPSGEVDEITQPVFYMYSPEKMNDNEL